MPHEPPSSSSPGDLGSSDIGADGPGAGWDWRSDEAEGMMLARVADRIVVFFDGGSLISPRSQFNYEVSGDKSRGTAVTDSP